MQSLRNDSRTDKERGTMLGTSAELRAFYSSARIAKPEHKSTRKAERADEKRRMARFLRAHPGCQIEGCRNKSVSVHHVTPRQSGGTRDDAVRSEANWLATCTSHHLTEESLRVGTPPLGETL